MNRKKAIAYVIGELFYHDTEKNSYISRFSAGNFLKLLQENLEMECGFVFPVGKKHAPEAYSASFKPESYKVIPLPGWEGVLSYYRMLFNPKTYFFLRKKIIELTDVYDIFWIRIPHPFGLWLGRVAEKKGKFVMYNVVGDIRLAHNSDKYTGLNCMLAKIAGNYFHKKSLSLGENGIFFCVGSVLCDIYKKAGKRVEYFVHSLVRAEDMKPPKKKLGNPLRILYVGKMVWSKGIYLLLDAMDQLGEKINMELHIVGHGEDGDKIREMCKTKEYVEFHGFVPQGPELNKIYSICDILILPTISSEGFPRVILEAWSNGLFVVSADVGGIRGLGKDSENILFFEPGSIGDLVDKTKKIIENPEIRDRIRNGIVEVQKKISSECMISTVKKILMEKIA